MFCVHVIGLTPLSEAFIPPFSLSVPSYAIQQDLCSQGNIYTSFSFFQDCLIALIVIFFGISTKSAYMIMSSKEWVHLVFSTLMAWNPNICFKAQYCSSVIISSLLILRESDLWPLHAYRSRCVSF